MHKKNDFGGKIVAKQNGFYDKKLICFGYVLEYCGLF
jgi:hypothetical protein